MGKASHNKTASRNKIFHLVSAAKPAVWFFIGIIFASFCLATFALVYFRVAFADRVIPGVFAGTEYIGEKTPEEIKAIFDEKNKISAHSLIAFSYGTNTATISAQDLNIGYNSELIATQAESLGKSPNIFSNIYHIINSYLYGMQVKPSYQVNLEKVNDFIEPIQEEIYKEPVDALFQVEGNRVATFKQSEDGKTIDYKKLHAMLEEKIPGTVGKTNQHIAITIPIEILKPEITTEEVNNFGIVEEIGSGTSTFTGSIPNRVHNVALAANRMNGILVAPGEEFSFVKYLGDVSKFTGYKEAYVISGGRTVLGDGGGVCQVSTTLFRAILNSGLPITERVAHAYRVSYYEQDSKPGIDATVYVPTVDLKFKNDTGNHILIQSYVDQINMHMSFTFYGKKDGREATITQPVIHSQSPAPEPLYQDDPNLPIGQEKQIDFAASGANVSFSRTVKKNGEIIIQETFRSNYRPWQAVFLRGTKAG